MNTATESFTKIPNVLIDTWLPILPASEFAVLICVARYTLGFHRGEIDMGMRLISARTGLHLQTVSPAVRALENRGLIVCTPGFRGRISHQIQLDVTPLDCSEKQNTHEGINCSEKQNSECMENQNSSVLKNRTRERNHHQKKRRKEKEGLQQFGGTHQSGVFETPGAPETPRLPVLSKPNPKPLLSSLADDDENPKPPARERLPNPEAEFLERLRERGHATGVNGEHVLRSVKKQLDKRRLAFRLNDFLDYEVSRTTGRVRNPAGLYVQIAREWDADELQLQAKVTREMTKVTVEKPVNDCPLCVNSSMGKGAIVNEGGGFEACQCSPQLAEMLAQMEQQRKGHAA